jgi:hypothetical protein
MPNAPIRLLDSIFNLSNDDWLIIQPVSTTKKAFKIKWSDFKSLLPTTGAGGIAGTYPTVPDLLSDQGSQTQNLIYKVLNASADPGINSGSRYYEYLGGGNGLLSDYTPIDTILSQELNPELSSNLNAKTFEILFENEKFGSLTAKIYAFEGEYIMESPGSIKLKGKDLRLQLDNLPKFLSRLVYSPDTGAVLAEPFPTGVTIDSATSATPASLSAAFVTTNLSVTLSADGPIGFIEAEFYANSANPAELEIEARKNGNPIGTYRTFQIDAVQEKVNVVYEIPTPTNGDTIEIFAKSNTVGESIAIENDIIAGFIRSVVGAIQQAGSVLENRELQFSSDLDTVIESTFNGTINITHQQITDGLSSVSYEVSDDDGATWTTQANIVDLQNWINANVTGDSATGTRWRLRALAFYNLNVENLQSVNLFFTR